MSTSTPGQPPPTTLRHRLDRQRRIGHVLAVLLILTGVAALVHAQAARDRQLRAAAVRCADDAAGIRVDDDALFQVFCVAGLTDANGRPATDLTGLTELHRTAVTGGWGLSRTVHVTYTGRDDGAPTVLTVTVQEHSRGRFSAQWVQATAATIAGR